jgi:hypothetical protein
MLFQCVRGLVQLSKSPTEVPQLKRKSLSRPQLGDSLIPLTQDGVLGCAVNYIGFLIDEKS